MKIRELLGLFSSEHVRAKGRADNKFGSVWINRFKDHVGRATGITSLAVTTNNSGGGGGAGSEVTEGKPESLHLSGF